MGITFHTDLSKIAELNFPDKLSAAKNTIRFYQNQQLSIAGRITVVKMHILPKFIHLLVTLPTPNNTYIVELEKILSNFVWNNLRPKISLNTLVQEFKKGGLKMVHMGSFCMSSKLTWVKK